MLLQTVFTKNYHRGYLEANYANGLWPAKFTVCAFLFVFK